VHTSAADVIAAFALALLFGYAFTWAGICLGMTLRSVRAARGPPVPPQGARLSAPWRPETLD